MIPGDFVITSANSGVSAQTILFNDEKTEATVDFQVNNVEINATFLITLANDSYTDQADDENKEITETNTVLPINITIDTEIPYITSTTGYDVTTDPFTLTINFNEALNLTESYAPILTVSNIKLTNVTTTDAIVIDNSGNGGTGRVVIKANIADLAEDRPTITINESAYSDTLGNTGGNGIYELTIISEAQESAWIEAGTCETLIFDGTGDGSASNPYQISHICHLQNIADGLNKSYILTENIDATLTSGWNDGAGFTIGDNNNSFDGTFDGGGFTLSNLTINRDNDDYIGLFGYSTGTLKDITLDSVDIIGENYVGTLVGNNNSGTISNSSVSGSVSGNDNVGGFVGSHDDDGLNIDSYTDDTWCQPATNTLQAVGNGSVTGITTYENCKIVTTPNDLQNITTDLNGNYLLINDIDLSIINNFEPIGDGSNAFDGIFDGGGFTLSNLTINRANNYIGVFSYNTGTIKDIILDSVDITGEDDVGGLAGRHNSTGTILSSSASGSVVGNDNIGGLAGQNQGTIKNNSSSSSTVSGNDFIGGIVGYGLSGTIENASSSGNINGNDNVGGFVGYHDNLGTIDG